MVLIYNYHVHKDDEWNEAQPTPQTCVVFAIHQWWSDAITILAWEYNSVFNTEVPTHGYCQVSISHGSCQVT